MMACTDVNTIHQGTGILTTILEKAFSFELFFPKFIFGSKYKKVDILSIEFFLLKGHMGYKTREPYTDLQIVEMP
jgi:hypothetical protein